MHQTVRITFAVLPGLPPLLSVIDANSRFRVERPSRKSHKMNTKNRGCDATASPVPQICVIADYVLAAIHSCHKMPSGQWPLVTIPDHYPQAYLDPETALRDRNPASRPTSRIHHTLFTCGNPCPAQPGSTQDARRKSAPASRARRRLLRQPSHLRLVRQFLPARRQRNQHVFLPHHQVCRIQ